MLKELVPIHDKVLIKPLENGEQRKGAILIADMGEDRMKLGKVVATGLQNLEHLLQYL